MQSAQHNLFTRPDTFFGVCEAIGQDFGFHPNILRIALGVLVLFNPVAVIGGYLAAGLLVLASRWLFPARVQAAAPVTTVAEPFAEQVKEEPYALAA